METVSTRLKSANIKRIGEDYRIYLEFEHGRLNRPYLPKRYDWPLTVPNLLLILAITDAKDWRNVDNSPIRIKTDYEHLRAVGHPIGDIWLTVD